MIKRPVDTKVNSLQNKFVSHMERSEKSNEEKIKCEMCVDMIEARMI